MKLQDAAQNVIGSVPEQRWQSQCYTAYSWWYISVGPSLFFRARHVSSKFSGSSWWCGIISVYLEAPT